VPDDLVVMLQGICPESLPAICNNSWVQQNFVLTESDVPQSIYDTVEGPSFVIKTVYWEPRYHNSLMMIPKSRKILNCFRVPLQNNSGKDAPFANIEVSTSDEGRFKQSIRLCTTRLLSTFEFHKELLAYISRLLKQPCVGGYENIAGIVGGNMNATEKRDHELHRTPEVNLKDVWKDEPAPPIPAKLNPGKKDLTYGQARGKTWGYQSLTRRTRKRLDKFFYTGQVETVALSEVGDVTGRFGRVGIDLKTEIEVWVDRKSPGGIHGTNMPYTIYHSETVGKRP
jgi:hypothetical protein